MTNAGFLISFTTTETGLPTTTNIDYGDVLMMRASLRAAEFVGHAFSGQDLHLNIGSAWQLQQGDLLTLQRVLADNPDFLKPGAFAERTAARTALLETIALYRQASGFIRARPAGLNRLFVIAPEELAKEVEFRKWLDKAERSLNSFVNVAKDGSPDQWAYLGALATADFSFRGLLPPIASDGTFDPEAIPDPSLGGAMVGITRAQIVNRLIEADLKPDLGVEWMNPKPQGNALNGYAYGAGTHVAVGAGGTLRTSTNGIDWTVKKLPTDANLQAVAYGNGRFVAVGYYTMWQSTDGQTWHEVKNAGGAFTAILYAGGRFVAMGAYASVTSVDGLTWQFGYHGFAEAYRAIVYSGTQYVAAGSGGALAGRILTSPDGLTWTSRLATTTGRLRGIASNGSRLVALGENNVLASSTDGVNWTVGAMMTVTGTPPDYFAVASKDGRFVATGGQSTVSGQQSVVATSTDGLTWTTVASGEQGNLYKAFAGPDAVYGFAWSGAMVRATDGSTFVRVGGYQNTAPLPTTLLELRDLGGKLYALGTGGVMMTSTDGNAFVAVSTGVTADLWSVVRQGNVWLAVGNGGTVLKSADGLAWTPLAIGTAANLRTVAYLNGLYLVAGGAGTLFTSTDGTTWTQRATGLAATGTTIYGLAYGNGTYMAVGGETGNSRVVLTSADGVTWVQRAVGEYPSFRGVVFQDGLFTALGSAYGIYRSANGITWNFAADVGDGFQSALRSVGGRYHAFSSPVDGAGETSPTEVRISVDGAEWYKVTLPVVGAIYAAERFQGRTYLAGASGAILRTRPVAPSSAPTVRVLTAGRQLKQGDTFALAVSAAGDGQFSYQWKKDGNIIVGATTATFELGNVQTSTAGSYTVVVSNGVGSAPSAAMVITVDGTPAAPVIVGQPQGQTVNVGLNATLAVNAAGTAPFTYQWKKDSVNVSGGTAATLVLTGVQAAQAGSYTVVVTNTAGSATSLPAVLVVDSNVGYTFTTMAGMAGVSGAADGTGAAARFNNPTGVAVDPTGNVYLTDYYNHVVRRVTPTGGVTTVAGHTGISGTQNGIGTAAFFSYPTGLALDPTGATLFVVDQGNSAIRKIVVSSGAVTTFAGGISLPRSLVVDPEGNVYATTPSNVLKFSPSGAMSIFAGSTAGAVGSNDGVGTLARFNSLAGIARDGAGNLYVADDFNVNIRKITADGTVSTVAGLLQNAGVVDGPISSATFTFPSGIVVDAAGAIYVSDYYAQTLRKVAAGVVRTIGGLSYYYGSADGVGAAARFAGPAGLAMDSNGNVYLVEVYNHTLRKGTPSVSPLAPVVGIAPPDQTVGAGASVTLGIAVAGVGPFTYQWFKDGSPVANGTGASLPFTNVSTSQAGTYSLSVANAYGSVTTKVATLVVNATPTGSNGLVNGSVRTNAGIGVATLTGVFSIEGTGAKQMLVRAVGPSLTVFGVVGALADPRIEIVDASTGALVAFNEDWGLAGNAADVPTVTARVGAFPLAVGGKDAVVLANFAPGTYRVRVAGAGVTTGSVLLEIYDASTPPRLVYLATRGQSGTGSDALIQGFVVNTLATGRSYLIRALGPSLGVPGAHPVRNSVSWRRVAAPCWRPTTIGAAAASWRIWRSLPGRCRCRRRARTPR